MSIVDNGGGNFVITPEGDNPRKIPTITLTLDANSVGKFRPVEAAPSSHPPASSPDIQNGATIHWFTSFRFTPLTQETTPSFTLVLPSVNGSTYVFYNEENNNKLVPLGPKMTVDGGTVRYHLSMSDPSVGMT